MTERAMYWTDQLAACERSGLTQSEFCRREGLNVGTFAWWKRQLRSASKKPSRGRGRTVSAGIPSVPKRRGRPAKASGRFVEVRLADAATLPGYEIMLRCGRTVRVPSAFDPQTLSRLIEAVESC